LYIQLFLGREHPFRCSHFARKCSWAKKSKKRNDLQKRL
jgi:hypothetical protein